MGIRAKKNLLLKACGESDASEGWGTGGEILKATAKEDLENFKSLRNVRDFCLELFFP